MKARILYFLFGAAGFLLGSLPSYGQLSGTKYIPGDYSTISSAVIALNGAGVGSGGVIFNIAANYSETISTTISLTATGTLSNPIIFQKDPVTSGANPLIISYTGGVGTPSTAIQDGIWRLIGSDYVTINGIDLKENIANSTNPSTMEYGYGLYKASTSNGCQYVTIQNCVITLSNINNATGGGPVVDGSAGIIMMNSLATTATTATVPISALGTNSNNRFYNNTIQNCNTGIALIGYAAASPFTLADTNNDIGGNSVATGNTIVNYGGATGATNPADAIRTLAQYGLNISYNRVNNNNGGGTNHPSILYGILNNTATSASAAITNNTITLNGGGTTQALYAINNVAGSLAASNTINISNNTVTNSTYATATTGTFYGIYNSATPATLALNNNTLSNNSSSASTTGAFYGFFNSGAAASVSVNNNAFSGNSVGLSTGLFCGIYNSGAASTITITGNSLSGNSTSSATGLYYPIWNAGAVTSAININSNSIGNSSAGAITFTAANSGAQLLINNTAGAATAALSISNNDFQGINYTVGGTGANTYISNTAATLSQAINSNTFTNLSVNTTGSITFIANSVVVSASGTQNVNGNSIAGSFNKPGAGGTLTLFTSAASSVSGGVINQANNNFSNITVSGATTIAGWVNTDAGAGTKTIQNNTFSNWTGGTGAITGLSVNITAGGNATTGNAINTITSSGNITGIATAAGNDNIYGNNINTLVSSGTVATTVTGISVTAGTAKNIYQNTIYNLQGNTLTTGSVKGISISGGTTVNAYQNIIYTLKADALTTGTLSGMAIATAANATASANKIYDLSSASAAITTGTVNGIQVSGATAGTATTLVNNLVGDLRTPSASAANPVIGISVIATGANSTINVYYNTVYLNATSTGTNFGTSGVYHTANATSTTAQLNLINNIITNTSTPNGTGITVAFRRSSANLSNYGAASNNNLFYDGAPSANMLLFYDGTNADQSMLTYQARVAPRDAQSVTEDMITTSKFLSTSGSSASFLMVDPSQTTLAESGGINISGITTDYNGTIRQGNPGYSGTGTAPDIGADEFNGTHSNALAGTYYVGTGQTYFSLTKAGGLFAAVNSLGLKGNVVVKITSDLSEDGTYPLFNWAEQGVGNYTLTIEPDTNSVRLISGAIPAGMIRFNGADRVTIDGSNGGSGNYLTFRNLDASGTTGTAITFINGASNNTIRYSNVEAYANATNGVILFSTSTIAGGNSNNVIRYCNINATVSGNTGNVAVCSAGTAGNENTADSISNNNIFNYRDRAVDITATGSTGWVINNNSIYNGSVSASISYAAASTLHGIRVLGGSGYSILNNYIGGSGAMSSGAMAAYTSSAGILSYQGILLTTTSASPVSNIMGNTINNISVSAVPTSTTAANVLIGIESNGFGINIGGTAAGNGNTIGSNTANGSIQVTTTTTLATYLSLIKGINCNSSGGMVTGNIVGGIDINNVGAAAGPSTFTGIYINNATAPAQVNNNIIGSSGSGAIANSIRVLSSSASTRTELIGIALTAPVISSVQLNGNTIKNVSFLNSSVTTVAAGGFIGISTAATGAAAITISNDTISAISIPTYTTGYFYGIYNSGAASTVTITGNSLSGNSTSSATGLYYPIWNAGAVTSAININSNSIGNSSAGAITFTAANSGAQLLINNTAGAATAALSISNNDFQGINYTVGGTGANTYISNTAATLSQAINSNTFTNLNVNTTGSITFIANSVAVSASGTQNVNGNSIAGSFNKPGAGGTLTLFTSAASSVSGGVINQANNNFSNITVSGATTIAGWVNTDAGAGTKTIQNNTFSNWTGGTGAITGLSVNITAGGNATTGNAINTITSSGNITGIATAAGNDNIYGNNINTLVSSGTVATTVTGISVTAGTAKNIYQNTIYNLQGNTLTTGSVKGISISGGTTVNAYQNIIYTLKADALTTGTLSGMAIATAANATASANKIYDLSSASAAITTGTVNGIQVSGATAGTATTLVNNLVGDLRTPSASAANPVIGISVIATGANSTINVYYNTVYLNATSTGTNFGTSGVYHTANATSTTAQLNLINNIITNTSTPNGTGITVAFRRSSANLSNYGAASNNNLFFAGIAGPSNLIYYDGTNADQSMLTYQARVAPRDAQSVTEDMITTSEFLSTSGSSASFLMVDPSRTTLAESGGINISGIITDYNGTIRQGNPGYSGTGTAPDIGADEFNGTHPTALAGTYYVGTGQTYFSLTKAGGLFAAVNSLGLKGNVVVKITSDLSEDGTYPLFNWAEQGVGNYTLTIEPDTNIVRLISGAIPAGMIRFNGADRVTIDGSNGGSGNYLTFRNLDASGTTGTAITFINGASNNTIRYSNVEAYANATNGVILFSTSTIAGGNSNNVIRYCNINATVSGNTGNVAVCSAGTAGNENTADSISNNNIFNYRDRAVDITATGSTGWVINKNSIYNGSVSASISYAAASTLHGIRVLGGSGYSIVNNYIGGSASLASGSNAVYASTLGNVFYEGILLNTSGGSPLSAIKGNTVAAISVSAVPKAANSPVFTGIETNGSAITIGGSSAGDGNTIGATGSNSSIIITTATTSTSNTSILMGMNCASAGGSVTGNMVSGIDINNMGTSPASSAFTGLFINNATPPSAVTNNLIGSRSTSNSIRVLTSSSATTTSITGISVGSLVNTDILLNGNLVENLGILSLTSSGWFTGISNAAASGLCTISADTIQNINSSANANSGSTLYAGISSSASSAINNNIISNISLLATGSNAEVSGISVSGAFVHTIGGNIISNLSNASSDATTGIETGSPAGSALIGIINSATVPGQTISNNILYNFSASNTSAANTAVYGIGITSNVSGDIFDNHIAAFTNFSTGSGPGICGVMAGNGTFNLYNNSIRLDNAAGSNGVKIYGIIHAAGNNWNYFHNTVKIGGNSTGTSMRSAAFIQPVTGNLYLRNNIFVNARTGTGLNYAISNLVSPPNATWPSSASDYNDLFSADSTKTGEWGTGVNKTFSQWQSASGGETSSVSRPVTFLASAYDLQPDTTTNCTLYNSGTPITSPIVINKDINNKTRSTISPSMGAYEFGYTSFIPVAGSNAPVCAGGSVSLTANPGTATGATYSWTDPTDSMISSLQNPVVAALAGTYKVTVTDGNGCHDSASTIVALNNRPTSTLSGSTSVCAGSGVVLSMTVKGSGTLNGSLNNGAMFSGVAPTISLSVSPDSATSYYITALADSLCASQPGDHSDTVRISITPNGQWIGVAGTNWNASSNWCGGVPTDTTDVTINTGAVNYPLIKSPAAVHNINIAAGASLMDSASLKISGAINNLGIFNATAGTVEMSGTFSQIIPANAFLNNAVNNLIISNTSIGGVSLSGPLDIYGSVTFSGTGMTFVTNDNLTFKSTISGTAWLGDMTGNSITGMATVERYISSRKGWRLLSIPTKTGQTIQQTWQEGCSANGNCVPGFGTQITGAGGTPAGFDATSASPSMKKYNPVTNAWVGVPNTNATTIKATDGYMVFVRGDRSVTTTTAPATPTVLRTKGNLYAGDQPVITVAASQFGCIGNPYPSAIDMRNLSSTGLKEFFYLWDPMMSGTYGYGAYQTFSSDGSGNYVVTPGGGSYGPSGSISNYIQSGQAFFVQATSASAGTITLKEGAKTTGSSLASVPATAPLPSLRVNLLGVNADKSTYMSDGFLVNYGDNFSNAVDDLDAIKSTNTSENLSVKEANKLLVIERKQTIQTQDTIFFNLSNVQVMNYQFQVMASGISRPGLTAFLIDNYLKTSTPLNIDGTTTINFNIANIAGSYAANRFMIVFTPTKALPVTFTSVNACQQGNTILVTWKVDNESNIKQYEVEKSTDGNTFATMAITPAKANGGGSALYQAVDSNPVKGYNYYRVKSVDINWLESYTQVVKVQYGGNVTNDITIYPNPIHGGTINIQLISQPAGIYNIHILNQLGQTIASRQISHAEGTGSETIQLDRNIAHGIYKVEVTNSEKVVKLINVIY